MGLLWSCYLLGVSSEGGINVCLILLSIYKYLEKKECFVNTKYPGSNEKSLVTDKGVVMSSIGVKGIFCLFWVIIVFNPYNCTVKSIDLIYF